MFNFFRKKYQFQYQFDIEYLIRDIGNIKLSNLPKENKEELIEMALIKACKILNEDVAREVDKFVSWKKKANRDGTH